MPTALSDPSTSLYLILGAVTVVLGAVAARRQRRSDLLNFAIPAGLLLALFLIDLAFESPREQVVRALKEMEAGTQNKKYDDVFKHVSDKFQYKTLDKKALQQAARSADSIPNWEGVVLLDVTRDRFSQPDKETAVQVFEVKPLRLPGDEYLFQCEAIFKLESGQWRLTGCTFFKTRVENGKRVRAEEVTPPGL